MTSNDNACVAPADIPLRADPALLLANVNPKIVSERLGHSTVTLTRDTYAHVPPTMPCAAADQLEQMLFG